MSLTLIQLLELVRLDDAPGDDTSRERFRRFLRANVGTVSQVRSYIEECLTTPGDQYSRALQDLVNHLGRFLGFEVTFGRYQGAPGHVGFDGHWQSPTGFHLVVEVKTSDVYAIKSATLVGYVDALISEKKIPNWECGLGLYVIGRLDPGIHQLRNAIIAEKRTHQLRIISVDSLLSLAELMHDYGIGHKDILSVLQPSGPTIDLVVEIMTRLAAQRQAREETDDVSSVSNEEQRSVALADKPVELVSETGFVPLPTQPAAADGHSDRRGHYRMRILEQSFECDYSYEVLVNTANWLIKSGKLKAADCPVSLEGRDRYTMNSTPSHPDNTPFRAGRQLIDGLWIETHYNRDDAIRVARQLLDRCGISPDALFVQQPEPFHRKTRGSFQT